MEDISHFVKIDSNWGASYICRTPINFFFPLFGLVFGMDPASIYIYIHIHICSYFCCTFAIKKWMVKI
jgi:hypothetical protein